MGSLAKVVHVKMYKYNFGCRMGIDKIHVLPYMYIYTFYLVMYKLRDTFFYQIVSPYIVPFVYLRLLYVQRELDNEKHLNTYLKHFIRFIFGP